MLDADLVVQRPHRGLVVEVQLQRDAVRMLLHEPDPPARAVGVQDAGLVAEDDRVGHAGGGHALHEGDVVLVGVHRREAEVDLRRGDHARDLGDLRDVQHLVHVVQAVEDPEAADAVLGERADPQLDDRMRRDAHADDAVGARARPQDRARQRGVDRVEVGPWVALQVADEHLERRGPGQIHHAVARGLDRVGHGQDVAGVHAHAPQRLLPVTQRLVDELDVGHQAASSAGVQWGRNSSSSQRVCTWPSTTSGWAMTSAVKAAVVATPVTWS